MGKRLRFSVGIPTRNQADFLPLTLDSLLQQTVPPDEIVVSDHQSTDGTAEIIRSYAARYPEVIRGTEPPSGCGVSGQWQHTLSQLTCDWVTLFSSDDLARPNFCQVLLEGAGRRRDAVLVRAGWENIDASGTVLSQEYMLSVRPVTSPPQNLLEQRHGPKASFAAFAVQREALALSGGYPRDMESFGDWPMFAQLAPFGSFIYESKLISGYRVGHEGNKFRRRIGPWLRDEFRMFTDVFPLAAERLDMQDRGWITEASKTNFLRYLAAASKEFSAGERTPLIADFKPWAESIGAMNLLERFAAGQAIRQPITGKDLARKLLRPLAHQLAHRFRIPS